MDFTWFSVLINIFVYGLGYYVIYRNGGIRNNLIFSFCIFLFTIYYFITPFYFYCVGRTTIWGDIGPNRGVGVNISDYYDIGLLYYGIATLFFVFGYITYAIGNKYNLKNNVIVKPKFQKNRITIAIIIAFVICYGLVLFNFINDGFNPVDLLLGNSENVLAGQAATSNYLKNFSDSIIAIIIIATFYKVPRKILIPIIILSFALFILMGFRYRIILSLIGIGFCTLYINEITKIMKLRLAAATLIFLYTMFFITYNRFIFVVGDWEKLKYDPREFEYELFFEQTRGMLDDINIIQYYYTNANPKHDYGVTFLYFLVRMMPRSLVGDDFKDSFYPFPAHKIIVEAYDVEKVWGKQNTGEAPLHLAYFYIAYGIVGLWGLSYLCGIVLNRLKNIFKLFHEKNIVLTIILAASFFQWITRGYFPGFVDHLCFLLIGYWLVYKIYSLSSMRLKHV